MEHLEKQAYRLSVATALEKFAGNRETGLTEAEARLRLERHGRNELPSAPPIPLWRRFLSHFTDSLTILLLVATVLSFVAWTLDRDTSLPYETITIFVVVLLNGILGFVQENRAEHAAQSLQALSAPQSVVLREGRPITISAAEVVPGDILVVEEGTTLAADGRVIEAIALRVAESALTGESAPVVKTTDAIEELAGIGDQTNMVFRGTSVVTGRGRVLVTATGVQTELGKIALSLQQEENEPTPLQKELDRFGRVLGLVVIAIAAVTSVAIIATSRIKSWTAAADVLVWAVSLAVGAVPEALTAVTTIVLSLGMQRMARRHVIVRKLAAVETLGSTTVICSDKTGTLTKNEMTIQAVVTPSGRVAVTGVGYEPSGDLHHNGKPIAAGPVSDEVNSTLRAAALVNNAALRQEADGWTIQGDPTEGALLVAACKAGLTLEELAQRFPRLGEVPFSSERKLMSTVHADTEQPERVLVVAKGAPDVLLARCTAERVGTEERPLSAARRREILASVEQLAREALRTIGLACRSLPRATVSDPTDEGLEQEFVFLGIVGMLDPPRPEARESVKLAQAAGIRAIMITGDHPHTAAAIATDLGIVKPGGRAVHGVELLQTDDARLQELVNEVSVYARVAPEHKLRIVQALKAQGAITAMTGDGVNDAPALKAADIGVAMGITGTDVSKNASDMILTDDNFASIVAAVEEGRSIFANIQKFLRFLLPKNLGIVLTLFLGIVFAKILGLKEAHEGGFVVPLLATQILWINLLTDAGPALALGLDPTDPNVMKQPPRDPCSRIITREMWFEMIFVAVVMTIGTLLVMDWALPGGFIRGQGTMRYAQTMAFSTIVLYGLFYVFNARAGAESAFQGMFRNGWLWLAVGISLVLQIAVVHIPFLQVAFSTEALHLDDWGVCLAVASSVLWLRELAGWILRIQGGKKMVSM
ncbi:MAG: cation-translocating P-type ATPase [Blastocatellia bacterium]|nr:cation-translocating P-type ATPase [Blastocatellia bacterium]